MGVELFASSGSMENRVIHSIALKSFGPIEALDWRGLGAINLVIGPNGSGKTFLLKSIYSAIKSAEVYRRGNEPRELAEILADKLYWTFEPERIGDLVSKRAEGSLRCRLEMEEGVVDYQFGRETTRQIPLLENSLQPRSANSIFLPAKEVLSLHSVILKSRDEDKAFGFDDTYVDLARALQQLPSRGNNYKEFVGARRQLEELLGGKVEFDDEQRRWLFKKGNTKFPIGATAEGVKKIAILDTLLGNRYLTPESVVFIDEPEAALHPSAISRLLDIVSALAERGIQFFLASHSYFVIKKLYLIAGRDRISIPLLAFEKDECRHNDLIEGMPENSIVEESIRLHEEEIDMVLR